jgi:hypothetical protein
MCLRAQEFGNRGDKGTTNGFNHEGPMDSTPLRGFALAPDFPNSVTVGTAENQTCPN